MKKSWLVVALLTLCIGGSVGSVFAEPNVATKPKIQRTGNGPIEKDKALTIEQLREKIRQHKAEVARQANRKPLPSTTKQTTSPSKSDVKSKNVPTVKAKGTKSSVKPKHKASKSVKSKVTPVAPNHKKPANSTGPSIQVQPERKLFPVISTEVTASVTSTLRT